MFHFYLELLKKLTAIPENILDLFNPQEGEILGKSQGHIPHLQGEQREMQWAVTGIEPLCSGNRHGTNQLSSVPGKAERTNEQISRQRD